MIKGIFDKSDDNSGNGDDGDNNNGNNNVNVDGIPNTSAAISVALLPLFAAAGVAGTAIVIKKKKEDN